MERGKGNQPVMGMQGKRIKQVGIVVKDAPKTAKRYSKIFGIGPWTFYDILPDRVILHDKALGDRVSSIRIAMANMGKMQFELLQPLYGPSTHMEFLNAHGEGVHHLSFGIVEEHDQVVSSLRGQDIEIEMQGYLGDAFTFTYMATQKDLGTIFEVLKPPPRGVKSTLKPWGTYAPHEPGLIDLKGKEIARIGIVVEDVLRSARRFWEILGIGPWSLVDLRRPHLSDGVLHGIKMGDVDTHVKAAFADHGDIRLELLEPVSGPSSHMDFLRTRGGGVHHVGFGQVDDHDKVVSILTDQGFEIEMTGIIGGVSTFTYMASQKELGSIFELGKVRQGVETGLSPYDTYPPSK